MSQALEELNNVYFALRHGRSAANEEEIIVSDPKHGVAGYGLTEQGKKEVRASAQNAKDAGILDDSAIIISSDFARAKETAEILAEVLGIKVITFATSLRERYFGDWEKTHNSNYQNVWADDSADSTHKVKGVESIEEVLQRAISLIADLEAKYSGKNIVLVSHGDTLQILQTAFEKVHPSRHRDLSHLKTAEIRALN